MSTVFRHGALRLYLLKLLSEQPRHGYEVISVLEDRFMGLYAPSAGTVYPRLAKLESEGLVEHEDTDGRKVYRLTAAGRAELDRHAAELLTLEADLSRSVTDLAKDVRSEVRASVRELRDELKAAAREVRRETRVHGRREQGRHGPGSLGIDLDGVLDAIRTQPRDDRAGELAASLERLARDVLAAARGASGDVLDVATADVDQLREGLVEMLAGERRRS